MEYFKKDTYLLGVITGIVLPTVLYVLLYVVDMQFDAFFGKHLVSKPDYLYLLSVIANILSLRYFYTKTKKEKAGAGVLIVTIVIVLLYFFNFYQVA